MRSDLKDNPESPAAPQFIAADWKSASRPYAPRARVRLRRTLRALGPAMSRPTWRESMRAALGAGLGLALCGAILISMGNWIGAAHGLLLIAPLGATAFLVFAVPNSPLAQPWSAMVGNAVSAFVAVSVLHLGLPVELAAGLSVAWFGRIF